jgi:hypothetical protein
VGLVVLNLGEAYPDVGQLNSGERLNLAPAPLPYIFSSRRASRILAPTAMFSITVTRPTMRRTGIKFDPSVLQTKGSNE